MLSIEFQEAYKRLDKLCKECFSSNEGVSEYIRIMENEEWLGQKYVFEWEYNYKMLKHVRWIRNQFAHEIDTLQSDICSLSDLEYIKNFYELILQCSDPLTLLRKEKERINCQRYRSATIQQTNRIKNEPSFHTNKNKTSFFQRPICQYLCKFTKLLIIISIIILLLWLIMVMTK